MPIQLDEQTRQFLSILHQGGTYSYYWSNPSKKSIWWPVDQPEPCPNGRSNVYFGVHPVAEIPPTNQDGEAVPPENVRSQNAYIVAINCVFAEFDTKRFADETALKAHIKALEPAPSVVIMSGGGAHCYWLLVEPWILETDTDRQAAQRLQARWVAFVGGDEGAKDLARILRVPGTHNYKYETPRPVRFARADFNRRYALTEIAAYLPKQAPTTAPAVAPVAPRIPRNEKYLEEWARRKKAEATEIIASAQTDEKHKSRIKAARLMAGLIPHGLATESEVEAVVYHANPPKTNARSELKTIQDAIRNGIAEPLDLPPAPPEPIFDADGYACCPNDHKRLMPAKNGNGYRCPTFDCFWWQGEGYTQPTRLGEHTGTPDAPTRQRLKFTNAKELEGKQFASIKWAVPGLIPEGLTLFAGRPKMGKSWAALSIGIAIAEGGYALGKIPVEQGSVLYLALEDTERRLQDRLEKLTQGRGFPEKLDLISLGDDFPRLAEGGLDMIGEWLDMRPDARLITIDTFAKVRTPTKMGASVYEQDYNAMQGLLKLAGQRGVAVMVVHHTRKGAAVDALEEVSGSFGLSGGTDGVLVLKRDRGSAEAVLAVTGRDVEEQELALTWDASLTQWNIAGDAADFRISKERQELIDALQTNPNGLYPKDIEIELGKDGGAIRKMLHLAVKDGQVKRLESGRYVSALTKKSNSGNSGNSGNSSNNGNTPANSPLLPPTVTVLPDVSPQGNSEIEHSEAPKPDPVTTVTRVTTEATPQREPRESVISYVHRLIRTKHCQAALVVMDRFPDLDWKYEREGCLEALEAQGVQS